MPLILALSIACFAGAISIRLIDPIIPDIARAFMVEPAVAALLVSAFTFPYALGQPILGPLGDSIGKVRVIKAGLGVLTVCLALTAIAPDFETMVVVRALGGLAGGAIIPVALAMVGDRVAYDQRQVALSKILSAMLMAQFVSLIGSGLVADLIGWRYSLGLGALISAIAFVISMFSLKPRNVQREPFTISGLKSNYAEVFANPLALVCFIAVFVEGVLIFGILPYVAILLEKTGRGGVFEAGFVIAGLGIGGLVYTTVVRRVLVRLGGMLRLITFGGTFAAFGFLGIALQAPWPAEALAFGVLGFGFYAIHNSLQTQATELAPHHRGSAVALHAFFFFLGHAAGPPLYALAFDTIGVQATLSVAAVAAVCGGLLLSRLLGRRADGK
ncbi:MAG: MFS transporter [Hyphomicrobiaceae bacterium]